MNDISISELVERAEVGRASFYRNYQQKEDILKAHIDCFFREWMEEWQKNDRGLIYLLKDVIIGLCGPKAEYEKVQAYTTAFFSYALYGWIEVWFQRGMRESADEIAEMFRAHGL